MKRASALAFSLLLVPSSAWPHEARHWAGRDGVTNPKIILESKKVPVYPKKARRQKVAARTVLQALILKDGTVDKATVLQTTLTFPNGSTRIVEPGKEPGDDYGFGSASAEAVRAWRYVPATLDGEPVDVYFTVVVEFEIQSLPQKPTRPATSA